MKFCIQAIKVGLLSTLPFLSFYSNATDFFLYKDINDNLKLTMQSGQSIANLKDYGANDMISMIKPLEPNYFDTVLIFKDSDFRERWAIMTPDHPELTYYPGMNDAVSSIIITSRPLGWVNQNSLSTKVNGWSYPVAQNNLVKTLGGRNDKISSFELPFNTSICMWINEPPTSDTTSVSYSNWYLNPSYCMRSSASPGGMAYYDLPSDLNDKISAVELISN